MMNSGAKNTALRNENQNFRTSEEDSPVIFERIAVLLSYILVIILFPFAIFFCLLVVPEYERAVVLRLGRLRKGAARGPGIFFILPCVDSVKRVDLRTSSFDVPAQDILTKDSVTIKVDAIVYFRVSDPIKAVIQVVNAREAAQFLAQTTLRTIAGTKMLIDLLTSRERLSNEVLLTLDEATDAWGIKVERVEVKDIQMPTQLQRAMAAEQEAAREAKAKVAAADGELQSSTVLKEASETMAKNPIALQLRYLQTLNTVAADRNHTIIVPFPLDIIRKLCGSSGSNGDKSEQKPKANKQTNEQANEQANEQPAPQALHNAPSMIESYAQTTETFWTASESFTKV